MAKVHTSSLVLGKYLLTAKPREISETAPLDLCLLLYRLWRLGLDASVFTALVRLCEYDNTACPSMLVTASLPTMKGYVHWHLCLHLFLWCCLAGPPQQRKGIAGQALQQAWPSLLCPCPYMVRIHPCVDRWSCTQFHGILAWHSCTQRTQQQTLSKPLVGVPSFRYLLSTPMYSWGTALTSARSPSLSQGQPNIDRSAESH